MISSRSIRDTIKNQPMNMTNVLNTATLTRSFVACARLALADSHGFHVKPGSSDAIAWPCTKPGKYRFACVLPGHPEAGTVERVVVQ